MNKPRFWALAGIVIASGAGVAHAQSVAGAQRGALADTPWYESFTYSQGPAETMTGLGPSERTAQPAWSLSERWGVTVDLGNAAAVRDQRPDARAGASDERAVGAYFQFTPRVRVGGAVSVSPREARPSAAAAPVSPSAPVLEERGPNAGVRLESAFRF